MVKIDFDRLGFDEPWGTTYKYLDGLPTDSTADDSPLCPVESQEPLNNEEVEELLGWERIPEDDVELMPVLAKEDFEAMTIPAEDYDREEEADSECTSKDNFQLPGVPVEVHAADDPNPDVEHNAAQDSEPATPRPVGDYIVACAAESDKVSMEERQQQEQTTTETKTTFQKHQRSIVEQPTATTKRRRLDCFSFFVNLFKTSVDLPAPVDAGKPDIGHTLLHTDSSDFDRPPPASMHRQISTGADSDLDRVLLESASLHEAKELSVSLARVRLQGVMEKFHAKVRPVESDGNCQFRALALQLHGDEGQHGRVRAKMVQWLGDMKERYSDFVHEPYDDYLWRMATDGEWGDNVTLQAASDMLCRDIYILSDQPGGERISLHPAGNADAIVEKPLWLAFLAELHYDSVEFL